MCFSASASFIAGGGLTALGGVSLPIAKKKKKLLAALPLLFGIQQISEGFQWQSLNAGTTSPAAGYFFLFFASIVLPIYTPIFVFILDKKRRRILKWFVFLGIAVAIRYLWMLLTHPLVISKVNACISYRYDLPIWNNPAYFLYFLAIFGPLFISGHKIFRWLGVAGSFFAIIACVFFTLTFTSVWCFFAAIISVIIVVYVHKPKLFNS